MAIRFDPLTSSKLVLDIQFLGHPPKHRIQYNTVKLVTKQKIKLTSHTVAFSRHSYLVTLWNRKSEIKNKISTKKKSSLPTL